MWEKHDLIGGLEGGSEQTLRLGQVKFRKSILDVAYLTKSRSLDTWPLHKKNLYWHCRSTIECLIASILSNGL